MNTNLRYNKPEQQQIQTWPEHDNEVACQPLLDSYQYSYQQREKISLTRKQPSWISRILLAIASMTAVFLALQTTLTVQGILYDRDIDPGGNTHTSITICFVLFVVFVAFTNILYNRKR